MLVLLWSVRGSSVQPRRPSDSVVMSEVPVVAGIHWHALFVCLKQMSE